MICAYAQQLDVSRQLPEINNSVQSLPKGIV